MAYSSRAVFLALVLIASASDALRLCHTNDFHAKYLEVGSSNVKCPWWDTVKNKCYSGIASLTTIMRSLKCDLKIQAGDWVQGSLLDTVFKQDIAVEAYKWVKYDFAVFGNHEFDYGNGFINDTIRAIASHTTWLSTNVFLDGDEWKDLPLHRFAERYDICWVSALTAETLTLSAVEDNVRIEDENKLMSEAIREKCSQQQRVVAITHQGYNNDLETCRLVKEIDVIIGGHSHTNMDNGQYPVKVIREDGSVCFVAQAYAHGRFVGVLDLSFDDAGVVNLDAHQYIPIDYRIERDLEVLGKVQLYNLQVSKKAGAVVSVTTDEVFGGNFCRGPVDYTSDNSTNKADCSMGALVCDSVLDIGKPDPTGRPKVCYMNGGSFRNSFAEGDITIRDLVNVMPFGNTVVSMVLTGKQLLNIITHGFSVVGGDNTGAFPGGLGNMSISATVDASKSVGHMVTVTDVKVGGEKLDLEREYVVLTNSYIATGGDGYEWPVEGEDYGTLMRDATQAYLSTHNPYDPIREARVLMSVVDIAKANERCRAKPLATAGDAMAYVNDETLGIETELDDTIVQPNKVLFKRHLLN